MLDPKEQARPKWISGLLTMAALMVVIAIGMYYPFSGSVSPAVAADSVLSDRPPADLSRFDADAWFLPDDESLGFVRIEEGPFLMGSDPRIDRQAFDNERWSPTSPQGTLNLPEFYIGRYEVTVAQFRAFVRATGYSFAEETLAAPDDHPVVGVAWTDALAYARWIEQQLKESARTPAALKQLLDEGWRVTLPSEAQWEKAARGTDGRIFPWGNLPNRERANYAATSTVPVGSFDCPECPHGLSDMSGNAWEWTRSPFQPLPYDEADDREGLDADALWVMRGGSYADPDELIRAALRGGADPGVRRPFIGFRLAISKI